MKNITMRLFKLNNSDGCISIVAATGITFLWFCLAWRYGFDLSDEGYYWYGAQRVLRGEVPLRDFLSYDIGRYYWAATLMYFMGEDGILGARVSAAFIQALGTFLGVYLCLSTLRQSAVIRWLFAAFCACVLTVWVWPYYKSYDHAMSIVVVAFLVLMLKVPARTAWLVAGLCLGVVAMVGRNHGAYGALAATLIVLLLLIQTSSRRLIIELSGFFLMGVLIGFSPTLYMMLSVEGFAGAFVESIVMQVKSGTTNITLPVPWPWSWSWSAYLKNNGNLLTGARLLFSAGFVFLLAFPLIGLLTLGYFRFNLSDDRRKILAATIAVAIPYAHYALSRADPVHLSAGVFPALIGVIVACGSLNRLRMLLACIVLLSTSFLAMSNSQPYLAAHVLQVRVLSTEVDGRMLWIYPGWQKRLHWAKSALTSHEHSTCNFLALPDMTSLYAIYRTKMPIWETYALSSKDTDFQTREIELLESCVPQLVLLSDHALDGNPNFRYSYMYPLIYKWIGSKYQVSSNELDALDPDLRVYVLKK